MERPRRRPERIGPRPFCKLDLSFPGGPVYQYKGKGAAVIYALVDSRDETVRYVGMSRKPNERLMHHRRALQNNPRLRAWVRELVSSGSELRMVTIGRVCLWNWEKAERRWIGYFRLRGDLYNIHHGGIPDWAKVA